MEEQHARYWWLFLVRGVLALLFGAFVLMRPAAAVSALVMVFGVFALADGIVALAYAFAPGTVNRWALGLGGALGIVVGYITLRSPGITAIALYTYIAFWAIFVGAAHLAYAIRLRKVIAHEGLAILTGLLQVALGVLLLALPAVGVVSLVWMIAVYAFFAGGLSIGLAFRLQAIGSEPTPGLPA